MTEKKCPILTTSDGNPIGEQQAITAGPRGPLLMQDVQLLEQMQHFNRERIPERSVHANGSGAHGTLTITNDISRTEAELQSDQCGPSFSTSAAGSTDFLELEIEVRNKTDETSGDRR